MMNMKFIAPIYCLLTLITYSANAEDKSEPIPQAPIETCKAKKLKTVDYLRCLDTQSTMLTRQLSVWVNNKRFQLEEFAASSGHKSPLRIFKRSNKHFENYMSEHCRWQYIMLLPDTTTAAIRLKECRINLILQRLNEMQKIGDSLK